MERLRKVWRGRTMTFGVPLLVEWRPLEVRERVIKHTLKGIPDEKLYLVGGSFGLREFAQIRYDVHKLHGKMNGSNGMDLIRTDLDSFSRLPGVPTPSTNAKIDPALKEKLKQNTVTLESEYEKLEKSDLDNWENIRGPRLWEDSRTVQKQRREAVRLRTE